MTPPDWASQRVEKPSIFDMCLPMVQRELSTLRQYVESKRRRTVTFKTGLNDAQRERLALLSEELGEAIQAIGKILRHGYESTGPKTIVTNRTNLMKELGDILFAIELMKECGDINEQDLSEYQADKAKRVQQYLHYNAVPA